MDESLGVDRPRTGMLAGAVAWVLTAAYFAAQAAAQIAWGPSYSLMDNRISDLGATACGTWMSTQVCSPLHGLMNAAFIATGVLLLVGLALTHRLWPRRRLTVAGMLFLAIAGVCTVVIGLSPENANLGLHLVGALNIPCGNIGLLLLGLGAWRSNRGLGAFSMAMAVVGFSGLVIGPAAVALTGHGEGLTERMALYPLIVWAIAIGAGLLARRPTFRPAPAHLTA